MSETHMHQKMTTPELIAHMKGKGIRFESTSEDAETSFLRSKNDYFRVSAFRKLFPKHEEGEKKGLYIDLEFNHLVQLSYVDQSLRSLLRTMSLDVEHYQKVAILHRITEMEDEDGYSIVTDYKASLNENRRSYLDNEIKSRRNDVYCGAIIDKYNEDMPVWAFFEIISFGTFIDFCRFSANRWDDKQLMDTHYMLKKAKSVRNAASHGACIINGFADNDGEGKRYTPYQVRTALGKTRIPKARRTKWLNNPRVRDITTLVYLFSQVVCEGESKTKAKGEINSFLSTTGSRLSELPSNNPAVSGIDFLKSLTREFGLL